MNRIMWLEDDAFFVKKLMRHFEERGYTVSIYETAAEFLADLDRVPSSALVVIDILVPSGVGLPNVEFAGLEVLKTVSGLPTVPPLLTFSVVTNKHVEDMVNRYTTSFLRKPVTLKEFRDRVSALLGLSETIGERGENDD